MPCVIQLCLLIEYWIPIHVLKSLYGCIHSAKFFKVCYLMFLSLLSIRKYSLFLCWVCDVYNQLFCSDDGEEYTGLRSGVIISSQISNGSRSFLGNSSVILNFVHNVSNTLDIAYMIFFSDAKLIAF